MYGIYLGHKFLHSFKNIFIFLEKNTSLDAAKSNKELRYFPSIFVTYAYIGLDFGICLCFLSFFKTFSFNSMALELSEMETCSIQALS